jgi:hypothetical protein
LLQKLDKKAGNCRPNAVDLQPSGHPFGDVMELHSATRIRMSAYHTPSRRSASALMMSLRTAGILPCTLSLLISTLAPAFAGDVRTFPAKGVDLTAYRTYRLLPPKVLTKTGLHEDEPTVGPLIRSALRKELTNKGLTEVSQRADLEVASAATSVSIPQIEALIYNLTADGTSITGTAPLATLSRYNKEGTLYVNFIDSRTNRGVWLGISTRALGKPSSLENDINKAAQALFKKYPAIK